MQLLIMYTATTERMTADKQQPMPVQCDMASLTYASNYRQTIQPCRLPFLLSEGPTQPLQHSFALLLYGCIGHARTSL